MNAYQTLPSGSGIYFLNTDVSISRKQYGKGLKVFEFGLTPDLSASCQWHWQLKEIHFSTALTETVNCILYERFDKLIEISKDKEESVDIHNQSLQIQRLMALPNFTLDYTFQQVEASETAIDYQHKIRASNSEGDQHKVRASNSEGGSMQVFKANLHRAKLKGQSRRKRDPPRQQQHGELHQPRTSQSGEQQQQRSKCWRCDRGRHPAYEYHFKTAVCKFCGVIGHIKPAYYK
ncbi:hypothetical protein B566_EDAN006590 [Ephemera danica]|nr:hypothetical protein B566_EDAN006590 [Ephemera danica]